MFPVAEVAYVRFGTKNVASASHFASDVVGLEAVTGAQGEAWFRSDNRRRTVTWFEGSSDLSSVGIAYNRPEDLTNAVGRLRDAGVDVEELDRATCESLFVRQAYRTLDPTGNLIDLVCGPHHAGRRFFPTRDNGIEEFQGVSLRSKDTAADGRFWSELLGFTVRDWVGEVCYIGLDDLHHRVSLFPSAEKGVLSINFAVENLDIIMQTANYMRDKQIKIAHGPGRAAAPHHIFLHVEGTDQLLWGFFSEMKKINTATHRQRQFAASDSSLCAWGSCPDGVPEFSFI